ncbi:hypothetical protein FVEN_g12538 [Fusarium venenatum]|nr:hypothetical protein FVEN_g12538 [Fusarium venenatum]
MTDSVSFCLRVGLHFNFLHPRHNPINLQSTPYTASATHEASSADALITSATLAASFAISSSIDLMTASSKASLAQATCDLRHRHQALCLRSDLTSSRKLAGPKTRCEEQEELTAKGDQPDKAVVVVVVPGLSEAPSLVPQPLQVLAVVTEQDGVDGVLFAEEMAVGIVVDATVEASSSRRHGAVLVSCVTRLVADGPGIN